MKSIKSPKKDIKDADEAVTQLSGVEKSMRVDLSDLKYQFYLQRVRAADKIGRKNAK